MQCLSPLLYLAPDAKVLFSRLFREVLTIGVWPTAETDCVCVPALSRGIPWRYSWCGAAGLRWTLTRVRDTPRFALRHQRSALHVSTKAYQRLRMADEKGFIYSVRAK